ncbi:LUD domain-containing protein [Sphingomonas sp. JC676]|uniref:LutC/YkgG family protein n=1 Tax=Sphingomonas sp. JC676 TaxID=2768065 RepID=UPI0016581011|nr:LUD domain-containing protein [Sphingomonas sp. JC676]MBC9031893.1 LUD domain-containing protein [Sphingomonas sp. JC676]
MSARDAILARLRNANPSSDREGEARRLVEAVERPVVQGATIDIFLRALSGTTVSATHDRIAAIAELPDAVARYLARQALARALFLPPDPQLGPCDWSGGFALHNRSAPDEPAALAVARCGVAETGSLIFDTGPSAPMLPNFLCLHLIVLLRAETVVTHLEDIPPSDPLPRAHYWVTGVSGTTDIEGQYVRGAHGPRYLHVILLS